MELKRYLSILLRRWWLILIIFVATIAATVAFTYTCPRRYKTTVRLVVSPAKEATADIADQRASLGTLKPVIANTYAEIAQSPTILEKAWGQMETTSAQERGFKKKFEVEASVLYDTNILVITVAGPVPVLVQQLATAVTECTLDYVIGLYEIYDLKLLDPATLPDEPISPNVKLNLALGVVLGLGAGGLFAFLVEYLKTPLDQIAHVSLIDVKTGAHTSAYLLRRVGEEISRSKRVQRPFAVGVVHLADVEEMLQGFPPAMHQGVLKQVVRLFKQTLPKEDLVARWHAQDLAILMPDCDAEAAQQILERLKNKLAWTPFEIGETGFKLNFTAQVGLAVYDMDDASPEALLERAEQTLQETEPPQNLSHSQDNGG